ncbi:MAG: hypothetical protein J6A15_09780 [Clostridia bacterium]|nr:hypothetical protein [Clostridia bacterium]
MVIELLWDNVKVLTIEKMENFYVSNVCRENIEIARSTGFPIFFLKQLTVISEELPAIVKQRLSNVNNMKGKLKFKNDYSSEELEDNIYEYINQTECRRPTDKFSIKIEIK